MDCLSFHKQTREQAGQKTDDHAEEHGFLHLFLLFFDLFHSSRLLFCRLTLCGFRLPFCLLFSGNYLFILFHVFEIFMGCQPSAFSLELDYRSFLGTGFCFEIRFAFEAAYTGDDTTRETTGGCIVLHCVIIK